MTWAAASHARARMRTRAKFRGKRCVQLPCMPSLRVFEWIDQDIISRTTTAQYRAPEMCDLYSRQVISEKVRPSIIQFAPHAPLISLALPPPRVLQVDIWALGCMAYLLAFNRHAFPDGSALATLTGKYTIPPAHGRSQQVHLALNFPPFLSSPIFPACFISLPPAAHRRRRRLPCPQPQRTPVQ